MAEVQWLNHAGFALRAADGTCLVVDPWFSGSAFNQAWSLLAQTATGIDELADCRHIWISHEHPDHFSPAALASFPEQQRRETTVWYQRTRDGRVLRHCASLGFQVRELAPLEPAEVAPGLIVRCGSVGFDSWLHLEVDGTSVLDLNDCELVEAELEQLARDIGPVDVLLQQFSYANGMSNPEDPAARRAGGRDKLGRLAASIRVLQPTTVVPCASFVWFSHEENDYLNDEVVSIRRATEAVEALGVRGVVLHPGDRWVLGEAHDNASALGRYEDDVARSASLPRTPARPVDDAQLLAASEQSQLRLRTKNQLWALRPFARTRYLRPVLLRVAGSDAGWFTYDMFRGLCPVPAPADGAVDVELSADSLLFCLQHEFGMNTLLVNGRFTERRPGGLLQMRLQFSPSMRNNHGQSFPGVFLDRRFLATEARKLLTGKRRLLAR